jgi:nitrogen regulatory protein P-II 2
MSDCADKINSSTAKYGLISCTWNHSHFAAASVDAGDRASGQSIEYSRQRVRAWRRERLKSNQELKKISMKLIIAIIQPTKLEAVKEALSKVEVFRLTVMDVQGFGRQKGYTEVYRGHEVTVNLLRKIELQIAVNEDFVEPTVNAILEAGRSGPDGKIGDGKIFILPLNDCIRIRTGERGPEAI